MSVRTRIERVAVDRYFGRRLDEWKALRADGWDVVVLIEREPRRFVGRDVLRETGVVVVLAARDG